MATQVKFYSMTSASYNGITTKDAGGIYFLDNNEIYKGTKRFGANKVYTDARPESGMIAGDMYIKDGVADVYNGSTWTPIVNNETGLDTKASVGTSYVADAGVSVSVTLTSNAKPSLAVVVDAIEDAIDITNTATSVVAGKAVNELVSGLVSTTAEGTYVKGITRDA